MDTEITQEHADEELLRFCENKKDDPADLVVLKQVGYLRNSVLTEAGLDRAAALGVVLQELSILTLGIDVTVYAKDGEKYRLVKGSDVRVTFGGKTKQNRTYYEVYAGRAFPILVVFANSAHTFRMQRWPAGLPIEPRYL